MPPDRTSRALCTDLYELTMAAGYHRLAMTGEAAFELFVRRMPPDRGYLICAGLRQAVDYLAALHFTADQIDYLRTVPALAGCPAEFFDFLAGLRFTGSVNAVAEGTPVFAGEPLLRVEAPIIEAQLAETFLLSVINFQTLIATKAARVAGAARADGRERAVVDFGSRRAHGPDAAVMAARAAYIGGCAGTSNVEAGHRFGIPVSGTQAHSFIMAFESEEAAFCAWYEAFGEQSVMLVDTYDVAEGTRRAARAAPGMRGVRVDSGDLIEGSRLAREALDAGGLRDAKVLISGDLDEYGIARLLEAGAPADGFGVGTRLVTSDDAPYLSGVYKLVAVREGDAWAPRMKLSRDKTNCPGRKQVYRFADASTGTMQRDLVAGVREGAPDGAEPLLEPVLRHGALTAELPTLDASRRRAAEQIARLAPEHRRLRAPLPYPVEVSDAVRADFDRLAARMERHDG